MPFVMSQGARVVPVFDIHFMTKQKQVNQAVVKNWTFAFLSSMSKLLSISCFVVLFCVFCTTCDLNLDFNSAEKTPLKKT